MDHRTRCLCEALGPVATRLLTSLLVPGQSWDIAVSAALSTTRSRPRLRLHRGSCLSRQEDAGPSFIHGIVSLECSPAAAVSTPSVRRWASSCQFPLLMSFHCITDAEVETCGCVSCIDFRRPQATSQQPEHQTQALREMAVPQSRDKLPVSHGLGLGSQVAPPPFDLGQQLGRNLLPTTSTNVPLLGVRPGFPAQQSPPLLSPRNQYRAQLSRLLILPAPLPIPPRPRPVMLRLVLRLSSKGLDRKLHNYQVPCVPPTQVRFRTDIDPEYSAIPSAHSTNPHPPHCSCLFLTPVKSYGTLYPSRVRSLRKQLLVYATLGTKSHGTTVLSRRSKR